MTDIRISLTDKTIAQLPAPKEGWYLARDTELKGFFVVIGKRRRTFTVQGDLRRAGKRAASIRVSIGDASEMSARAARATAKGYLAQISRGQHPKDKKQAERITPAPPTESGGTVASITLRQAWERYLEAHLVRKNRSEKTIEGYRDHVERIFAESLDAPLHELATDPARVAKKHDKATKENGPYMANGSMRTLRAIYNHARKTNRSLPSDNPANAVDWNVEERRSTGMGSTDLKGWFAELAALDNLVRREFHLFTLLCGSRPTALQEAKPEHIDLRRRTLHIPKPKGGKKKAFDIPLSRQMILCLVRAIRFGRQMYPLQAKEWVFPADSASGHLAETKEDREILSKWGNDLRQTFRTIATAAGVSDIDAKLLMNHAIPGVNAGYITRHKLLEDHLRSQQAISSAVFDALGAPISQEGALQDWLGRGGIRRASQRAASDRKQSVVRPVAQIGQGSFWNSTG
ncbi:integrase arm-type DNA-binding domain-containing protein [Bradyrhizobium sp. Arg237L]|uniref:tyrosine-type recombinase/integrase n=1 Tax=Bradyrhizobium sp. Arg237L TaxID=3003352 RepID=UPI00249D9D26|nr:integrase arm-type DNA-binding domain-containing protein [Bradyrhizobium sp. Arg237L]MDI4236692.1 integrase arm-type DNA-binding domain-containing protein [Bradyrhizobium sp. Arg237L]